MNITTVASGDLVTYRLAPQGRTVSMQDFTSQGSCREAAKTVRAMLGPNDNAICVKG